MSWWIERRSKDGRRSLWVIDVDPMIIMVLLGLASTIVYQAILRNPQLLYLGPLGAMFIGATLIVTAKIPLYRQRIWNSWGTSRMSPRGAHLYRIGYVLLILGAMLVTLMKVLHNQAL